MVGWLLLGFLICVTEAGVLVFGLLVCCVSVVGLVWFDWLFGLGWVWLVLFILLILSWGLVFWFDYVIMVL